MLLQTRENLINVVPQGAKGVSDLQSMVAHCHETRFAIGSYHARLSIRHPISLQCFVTFLFQNSPNLIQPCGTLGLGIGENPQEFCHSGREVMEGPSPSVNAADLAERQTLCSSTRTK